MQHSLNRRKALLGIAHLRHAPWPAALRSKALSGGSAAGAPALSDGQVFCSRILADAGRMVEKTSRFCHAGRRSMVMMSR